MIGSGASQTNLTEFLLRETVNAAGQLGKLTAIQERQQVELTGITSRLSLAEAEIRAMKITGTSSPTNTDTHPATGMLSMAMTRFGPKALIWLGEKVIAWLAYYITPALLMMWSFATDQFWQLMGLLWALLRGSLRLVIG